VDLEVQVAAGADRVAGFADRADPLALQDPLTGMHRRRSRQVRVEVSAPLPLAVDQEVVAVQDRVVTATSDAAAGHRDQFGVAGGGDVEAFVDAAAVARGAEFTDTAPDPMRTADRKDVAVVRRAAVENRNAGRRGRRGQSEQNCEKCRAPQWCSITRSTMLYSFASSALMK